MSDDPTTPHPLRHVRLVPVGPMTTLVELCAGTASVSLWALGFPVGATLDWGIDWPGEEELP